MEAAYFHHGQRSERASSLGLGAWAQGGGAGRVLFVIVSQPSCVRVRESTKHFPSKLYEKLDPSSRYESYDERTVVTRRHVHDMEGEEKIVLCGCCGLRVYR